MLFDILSSFAIVSCCSTLISAVAVTMGKSADGFSFRFSAEGVYSIRYLTRPRSDVLAANMTELLQFSPTPSFVAFVVNSTRFNSQCGSCGSCGLLSMLQQNLPLSIGLGIGGTVLILILCAIGRKLWQRGRQRKRLQRLQQFHRLGDPFAASSPRASRRVQPMQEVASEGFQLELLTGQLRIKMQASVLLKWHPFMAAERKSAAIAKLIIGRCWWVDRHKMRRSSRPSCLVSARKCSS